MIDLFPKVLFFKVPEGDSPISGFWGADAWVAFWIRQPGHALHFAYLICFSGQSMTGATILQNCKSVRFSGLWLSA